MEVAPQKMLAAIDSAAQASSSTVVTEQEPQPAGGLQSSTFPPSQIPVVLSSGMLHVVGSLLALHVTPLQASLRPGEAKAHPSRLLGAMPVELRLHAARRSQAMQTYGRLCWCKAGELRFA